MSRKNNTNSKDSSHTITAPWYVMDLSKVIHCIGKKTTGQSQL